MTKKSLAAAIALSIAHTTAMAQQPDADASTAPREPTNEIEEISVIGRFVPDEKRSTSAVSNVVGTEEFTRSGDSNIADGLKRVAGLSLVGGKFIYVRGLGERYSSTLLNGSTLPSPEPVRRVVPLDLFPTAILDSVLVQKTYSAEFPSEFGGGVLQLRTKKATDEFFFNMSSSVGAKSGVNFGNGYRADGGDKDWLGYDDGTRDIPALLAQATAGDKELKRRSMFLDTGGYTAEELQAVGRSLPNSYNVSTDKLPADFSLATSLGNFYETDSFRLSYMAAVDYKNSWEDTEIERNNYALAAEDKLEIKDSFMYVGTENSVDVSTIFTTGLEFNNDHNIRTTSVLLRKSDDLAAQSNGRYLDADVDSRLTQIEYVEQELLSNQIQGEHYFPDHHETLLNWRYNQSTAKRDAPDTRLYRYDLRDELGYEFSRRADGNVRRYSTLNDDNSDYGVDLMSIFYGPASSTITLSTGLSRNDKERDSEIRRFTFFDLGTTTTDRELLGKPLEQILASENIGPDGFELKETTRPTDNYVAESSTEAYYLQGEVNLSDRFRLLAGVRSEDYVQEVTTFDLFRKDNTIIGKLESSDVLPAMTATFIHDNHQFRLGYSETLSRPDFRELSPATFTDPVTGNEVVGNPNLQVAGIQNYDMRWEWYINSADSVSIGLFHKKFDRPIEAVVQPGADGLRSFINADSGENSGIELEMRKELGFLGERWENFYVSGNTSFIESDVDIGTANQSNLTSSNRPLQGQSDWLFNAQIGYENFSGVTATLLYHYFGERISEVGVLGAPDLVEQPFGQLDLIYIKELDNHWKFSFRARNLLDERKEITQGGLITTAYREGRDISLKVDYQW